MVTHKKDDSQYTNFYRVMLILSTIGTSLGAFGIFGISNTLSLHSMAPIFVTCSILLNVITAVSIYALILLWQKKPLGISLKLSTYVMSIIVTLVALTGLRPYAEHVTTLARERLLSDAPQTAPQVLNMLPSVVDFMLYGGLIGSIIIAIGFAFLWRAAWRKQQAADAPSTAHHSVHKSKD